MYTNIVCMYYVLYTGLYMVSIYIYTGLYMACIVAFTRYIALYGKYVVALIWHVHYVVCMYFVLYTGLYIVHGVYIRVLTLIFENF